MKSAIIKLVSVFVILIFSYGAYLYFTQEELLFHPKKLAPDHRYQVATNFEEINITTPDNESLNCLLFKCENPSGLVIFYHGNSGSNADWLTEYKFYNDLGYDYLVTDYRGFGKSSGSINSQEQVLADALVVFDYISSRFESKSIVLIGYSFGTSIASYVASKREIRLLALLAPFYSLKDIKEHIYPLFPNYLLKYKFETNKYLDEVKEGILIFHGIEDKLISLKSTSILNKHLKKDDEYIKLSNQGHIGITQNQVYKERLKKKLELYK